MSNDTTGWRPIETAPRDGTRGACVMTDHADKTALDKYREELRHLGELAQQDHDQLQREIDRLRCALAFARFVIKSGEPWSETCEQELKLHV